MFKDVLLPVDREHAASWQRALPFAIAQCKTSGARLHVLTIVPGLGVGDVSSFLPAGYEQQILDKANLWMHEFTRDHVPPGVAVQHIVGHGKVHREILRVAAEIGADLIVMASHRPELVDHLLGSNAAHVVQHAKCSIMVVRDAA
ncbi:MAG: universal stress protein [Gammaproteobacteria bacterium]|nr:universal stress protein [Gammaproteobacteria bacterium]